MQKYRLLLLDGDVFMNVQHLLIHSSYQNKLVGQFELDEIHETLLQVQIMSMLVFMRIGMRHVLLCMSFSFC